MVRDLNQRANAHVLYPGNRLFKGDANQSGKRADNGRHEQDGQRRFIPLH
ncbi:Uncharacterised protein [Salmonella enterica subsp. enterica serovar Bovismorbificans]|uniref:Uncharacterized protein n=1 Tax=Salmonella enterica subsp. enterica serovar Bovismorbificans TaxID=58097 RepID=A0A655DCS9_SALET|nr:Uncharacterised protein [Salmonella enterica subsp. enterica serovar Bovismorbificans]